MARVTIKKRPQKTVITGDSSMVISRGPTNIKPPSAEEIEGMKIRQFIRKKRPGTTI